MKKATIAAACFALPLLANTAQAADYGQGVQYGPSRNEVQRQFDHEQYERSHYNSTRIVSRPYKTASRVTGKRFTRMQTIRGRKYVAQVAVVRTRSSVIGVVKLTPAGKKRYTRRHK